MRSIEKLDFFDLLPKLSLSGLYQYYWHTVQRRGSQFARCVYYDFLYFRLLKERMG